jgi:hypothetical protein
MDLIDKYNGLGSLINELNFEELENITGINFHEPDFDILANRIVELYNELEDRIKDGDEDSKRNAKYTLAFLIILFSTNKHV